MSKEMNMVRLKNLPYRHLKMLAGTYGMSLGESLEMLIEAGFRQLHNACIRAGIDPADHDGRILVADQIRAQLKESKEKE